MARRASLIALIVTVSASVAAAQPPRISNARVSAQPAGTPLAPAFRALVGAQAEAGWIGYSVQAVDGERAMCCFDSNRGTSSVRSRSGSSGGDCCGACRLERTDGGNATRRSPEGAQPAAAPAAPIRLEASGRMIVLFRVEGRAVDRIRVFSEDCDLDAGGRTVIWLNGVNAEESVALLESFAASSPERRGDGIGDGAVTAIALHADKSADAALDRLVAASQPQTLRRKVTFWLGNSRGAHGLATLQRVLRDDPSLEVRKGAVFGVSQSRQPGAFDLLAGIAQTDPDARVRSEGIFWLSQQGDARAPAIILQALEKDRSADVRKKAVFALSQLKEEAGTSALIRLAKSSPDAAVRGEAIFWLGQKAGAVAARAITERIDEDPDTEVKKRAVFALSQMPPAEGVPLLINVARTNATPAVRKQAMFWLGQSRDPRAVSFFEEVLAGK
jgi:HEAT repeat protein